ncbi:MAG TPA: glycosyltransferase family 52 [Lachnospiraceae bacterium]|nr:glycosyltransferase family 52 [Lachnospiraceae bacterium]
MKNRIYVCHTYYHVYVAFLKECKIKRQAEKDLSEFQKADILLSTMANDFGDLKSRMDQVGFFDEVIMFHERAFQDFPELTELKIDKGNLVANMISRIKFCKLFGKLEEPFIPVNMKNYKDIYIFCDSDPIGYFLNYKKIKYHALEDGLNCIQFYDTARYDNKKAFRIKALLSAWNLIFIQNGYGKYCIDMEVNNISVLPYPCKKYVEEPRAALVEALTKEDKNIILNSFMKDISEIEDLIQHGPNKDNKILVLTEPLCTLDIRERIFTDLTNEVGNGAQVFIKPHPRDILDYESLFPQYVVFDGKFPMEMLNFIDGLRFKKVYSILTEVSAIQFADECVKLGDDYLDKYEAPEIHRRNEHLK